ncbi:MAG TPA: VTT domain-containing protein [Gemmatimonadaceae bacterium]|nr:VTT domain-containing protein [Gemmatimonadaceae bacterium]
MQGLLEFFRSLRDLHALVSLVGTVGLTIIIFAETGLLVGFFLPGDSLLVTAGLVVASRPELLHANIYVLGIVLSVASILGNSLGYYIGMLTGPRLFTRENSLLFNKNHLHRAHEFYERHGGKTIILARFMPIIRTFVPVVAGMAQMEYRRYTLYNVIGGVAWIWMMLFTGYFLGRYIPGIDQHIELVIVLVIALSLLPGVIGWLRARSRAATTKAVSDV